MMVRVLAFCINAREDLAFSKGLSEADEPDIWARALDEQVLLWIDVGEPTIERLKKIRHHAKSVKVYCFNAKADTWWEHIKNKVQPLAVEVYRFEWNEILALAALVQRTMDMSISISGDSAYIATQLGECEVNWVTLQDVKE